MAVAPLIIINNLQVIYNKGKSNEMHALEETSLEIFPEEYVIIYGPSGCGKSTLLYSISGLQSPTTGEVLYKNQSLTTMTQKQTLSFHQLDIGMVFQAFYLISSLNVLDNVCLPQTFMGVSLSERRKKGFHLLRRFSIAEQADKFPNQLSGGQKQRVAIARSLVNDPEIILADEPVGNLDSDSSQNVLNILKELNEVDKKTVIMVTHNPEHLIYADRIIYMKDGRIINEEVRRNKHSETDEIKRMVSVASSEVTPELKLLMNSFKSLTPQQVNVLLVPFKAKQLLHYLLSELSDEQIESAEAFLRELLFKNIEVAELPGKLDRSFDQGGAGWNKKRATHIAVRIAALLEQVDVIRNNIQNAHIALTDYFIREHTLSMKDITELRLQNVIRMRLDARIDQAETIKRLNRRRLNGGVGLRLPQAEKISRELEIIMLLKFS
ncbi:MAG: ABC transporter ATP-binding protein [Candidatus Moraniibacteriota bacterium]